MKKSDTIGFFLFGLEGHEGMRNLLCSYAHTRTHIFALS